MILTTIKSGLHWSAHTPSGQFEQRIRNEQRIRRWRKKLQTRSGNTPTSSDAADPSSRPSGWEVFSDIACALLASSSITQSLLARRAKCNLIQGGLRSL